MYRLNRYFFYVSSIAALSFLFFSCGDLTNLEVPESVSVKASDLSYNFSLGEGNCLIRDKISASELRTTFNENLDEGTAEIKVYDYNPTQNDDDVLQYLIKYPIAEVPLSVSTDGTNDIEISTSFPVSNLNSKISDALKIEEKTYDIVETGTSVTIPETEGISFNITSPDFKTMKAYSGTFNISVTAPSNASLDFSLSAKIVLCSSDGTEIASSSEKTITGTTVFPLDLAGKTLVPSMKLKLSGTMSGGTLGNKVSYSFSMTAENLKISAVTGLNMSAENIGDLDNDSSTPDGTVSFNDSFEFSGINDSLVSAEIGKGSLSLYSKIPDGWTGLKTSITGISVSQGDDFSLTEDDFKNVSSTDANYLFNKTADISGKTIKPSSGSDGKVVLSGSLSVSFENATIVFEEGTDDPEIAVNGKCTLEEIKSIEISLSALSGDNSSISGDVDTGLNFSTLLEDSLGSASSLINNIKFSGIEGYIYAIRPELSLLEGLSYESCSIQAAYDGQTVDLIDSTSVELKNTDIDLDSLSNNDTFTITDSSILKEGNYSAKTKENSICEIFNAMPESLSFHYELSGFKGAEGKSTITLTQEDIDSLNDVKSVQIFILIQLPLEFTLSDNCDYPESSSVNDGYITVADVRALINEINETEDEDGDLFKRESAEDTTDEDKRKYLDLIKSVTVTYKTANTTGFEISGRLTDFASGIDKAISFENEETVIELTGEEISSIFDTYPFNPVVPAKIKADGTKKTIARNAVFGMSGKISVAVDGEVEIWSK